MYITSVLSCFGAWKRLQSNFPLEHQQIQDIIEQTETTFKVKLTRRNVPYSVHSPDHLFREEFKNLEWKINNRLYFQGVNNKRYSEIDALKNGVGVEFGFTEHTTIESHVFVKIPLFIRAQRIDIGAILVYSDDFTKKIPFGISHFGKVRDQVISSSPLIKHPFVIIGISDQIGETQIEEMTTELDQYLIQTIGYTLFELAARTENQNYDFKLALPDNNKIAKEACAFANTVGGGLMLVGADNKGFPVGIAKDEVDQIQLHIQQVVIGKCIPSPNVECIPFEIPGKPEKRIVVVRIVEIERKPCMVDGRIYIRAGASARPAISDEVRRLILSSGV